MTATTPHSRPRLLRASVLVTLGAAVLLTASCSMFRNQAERARAETAEEKAGRIAMVLGDDALAPDPDLAGTEVTLPDPVEVTSWPQAGRSETKQVGHVIAGEGMRVAWSIDAGAGSDKKAAVTAAPVTSDTTIFVLDADQTVRAFDISTGARRWVKQINSGSRRDKVVNGGGIAFDSDRVYVSSGFGFVVALDASDGSEVWKRDFGTPMIGSPTLRGGRVYVVSNNNEIFALSQATGATEWTDQAITESARILSSPSPAAVEDIVVVPFSSGEVITYLAGNGRRLWVEALTRSGRFTPISAINDIAERPVLAGGLVFAASQSGVLAAIDGRSGGRIWAQPVGSTSAPAVVGEYVFAVSVDAEVVAMKADTGQVVWVKQLQAFRKQKKKEGRISYTGPLVASGKLVVVSSEGDVIFLSPQTGEEEGRVRLKKTIYLEPIAAQGKILILTDDARLIAIQ